MSKSTATVFVRPSDVTIVTHKGDDGMARYLPLNEVQAGEFPGYENIDYFLVKHPELMKEVRYKSDSEFGLILG